MKTDKQITKVQFFYHQDNDDLFAYFPEILEGKKYNVKTGEEIFCSSYARVGQHSSCSNLYVKECSKATPEQYNALKEELISIGYNLKIV